MQLEECLTKIEQGEEEVIPELLALLFDRVLFTPVSFVVDVGDTRGTKKARVATVIDEGKKYIPTFASEELFERWSQGEYRCLPLRGGDLALTVPQDTGLLINPGFAPSVTLTADQVVQLAQNEFQSGVDLQSKSGDAISDAAFERMQRETLGDSEADLNADVGENLSEASAIFQEGEETVEEIEPQPIEPSADILSDLRELFLVYPEVAEAYFVPSHEDYTEAVLGLLTNRLNVERRFVLITEVGEIARAHFGFAGAIECYTDLQAPHSSSWELFKLVTPFYVQDGHEASANGAEEGGAEGQYADANGAEPQSRKKNSLWSVLTNRKFKFFG